MNADFLVFIVCWAITSLFVGVKTIEKVYNNKSVTVFNLICLVYGIIGIIFLFVSYYIILILVCYVYDRLIGAFFNKVLWRLK